MPFNLLMKQYGFEVKNIKLDYMKWHTDIETVERRSRIRYMWDYVGLWDYDLALLCITIPKDSRKGLVVARIQTQGYSTFHLYQALLSCIK